MTAVFTLVHRFMFYEDIDVGEVNQTRISGPESILFDSSLHMIVMFAIEIS